jgi:MFS family permease
MAQGLRANAYGWVIVAVGALMTCVGIGAMFSLAIFLEPMAVDTGWSRAGISSAMTLNFLVMGLASFGWGALSDRIGARAVVLAGSALLGLALVLASRTTTLSEFQLVYGALVGLAAGAFFAPMISAAMAWFDTHRSLAVSLVSAGVGVAPMTVSPFAAWLVADHGWRTAMLVIGIATWVLLIPAGLLVRRPADDGPEASTPEAAGAFGDLTAAEAFRTPHFAILAGTFFLCCAAHSGPIFHMVSYAIACGVAPLVAVTIYSVEGLAGLGGRILLGVLADRLGVRRVLVSGLLVQALVIPAYLAAGNLGTFYVLATVFGTAYGGVMPLYAVLARDYFGQRAMGTVFGAATMASSIGMALGPLGGGFIFDRFGVYNWLFVGSGAIGLAAVAVALAFPPLRSEEERRLQPA